MSSLHDAIMNLPFGSGVDAKADTTLRLAYKIGHKEARHAAAELAVTLLKPVAYAIVVDGNIRQLYLSREAAESAKQRWHLSYGDGEIKPLAFV